MRIAKFPLASVVLLFGVSLAPGGLIMYDGIPLADGSGGYTAGTAVQDNSTVTHPTMVGFSADEAWNKTTATIRVASTGLQHDVLGGEQGGAMYQSHTIQFTPSYRTQDRQFDGRDSTTGSLYAAVLMQFQRNVVSDGADDITVMTMQLAENSDSIEQDLTSLSSTNHGFRVGFERNSTEVDQVDAYIEYLDDDGTTVTKGILGTDLSEDSTFLLFVEINEDVSGESDGLLAWLNPTFDDLVNGTNADVTDASTLILPDAGAAGIDHLGIRGTYDHAAQAFADEFRWGDDLGAVVDAVVVPEPSAFILAAIGLLGLVLRARHRKR